MRRIFLNGSIRRFLEKAEPKMQEKLGFVFAYIADERNVLREPYVKHITIRKFKQFNELRAKSNGTMARIIFYISESDVILLYAFDKHGKRDTQKALAYADKTMGTNEKLTEVCI